ncbi:MAG: clpB, partial [Cyanobacteria bacterium RYN_339]|nr:clpB [Cyanobacteria bacterium RYN_339]
MQCQNCGQHPASVAFTQLQDGRRHTFQLCAYCARHVQMGHGPVQAEHEHEPDSAIKKYTRDLTATAEAGGMDPVIGREKEIERVVRILARKTKNNAVLVGEPGVGKTA